MLGVAVVVGEDDVVDGGAVLDMAVFDYFFEVVDVGGVGLLAVYVFNFGVSLLVDAVKKLGAVLTFADAMHFVVTGVCKAADAVMDEVSGVVIIGAGELGLVVFAVAVDLG